MLSICVLVVVVIVVCARRHLLGEREATDFSSWLQTVALHEAAPSQPYEMLAELHRCDSQDRPGGCVCMCVVIAGVC